jgi:hypothetical protein
VLVVSTGFTSSALESLAVVVVEGLATAASASALIIADYLEFHFEGTLAHSQLVSLVVVKSV